MKRLLAVSLSVILALNGSLIAFANDSSESIVETVEELEIISDLSGDSVIEVIDETSGSSEKSENEEETSKGSEESENEEETSKGSEETKNEEESSEGSEETKNEEESSEGSEESGNEEETSKDSEESGNEEETSKDSEESGNEEETSKKSDEAKNVEDSKNGDAKNDEYAVVITIESGNSIIEYYKPGEKVTLTVPSKEHYIFNGWNVECEESVTISNNSFTMPAARVDISAQWQPEEYSIAIYYLSDSGSRLRTSDYSTVMYSYEYDLDSDYVIPTIEGYTAYKIVRNKTGEETDNIDEYRSFIMIPSVEEDEIFYVYYKPAEVSFEVNHYLQNLDGSYSDPVDSETKSSTYGTTVSNSDYVGEYTGFTWNEDSQSINLAMTGNVVSVYYTRNAYSLYHQVGEEDTEAIEYLYGETINISDLGTPIRAGYTFKGWQTEDGTPVTDETIQMPAHDMYLIPIWEIANVYYTVRYWVESIDSANTWTASNANSGSGDTEATSYQFVSDKPMQAPTGTIITDQAMLNSNRDESITDAGYTFEKFDQNVTVKADGSSLVNVYYTRKTFSFRFLSRSGGYGSNYRNHTWNASNMNFSGYLYYKYGADLTAFWPETNVKWQTQGGTGYLPPTSATDGNDVTLYRNSNAQNTFYVKANYQKADGTYDESVSAYVDYETYVTTGGISSWVVDYNSMPAGYDFDVVYTSRGWVTPSVGDSYSAYRLNGGSNNTVYIKIKRVGYQISFSNSEEVAGIKSSILYGSDISNMLDGISITKPTGHDDFIFIGFKDENDNVYDGSTPEEAYANFANSVNGTMPAHNVSLTAVWQAPTYTVNFYFDETKSELLSSETVEYGNTVSSVPENPTRDGYTFINWIYLDGTTEKIYWSDKNIYSNLDIYPKWIRSESVVNADILVKHNYYDGDGNFIRTDEETKQGVVGSVTTVNAREDEGFFPDSYLKNITVEESGNVVEFNYKQLGEVEYTVRYVDADGNSLLPDAVKKSSYLHVTETYVYISRCTPRQISQTISLTSDPSNNIITFVYDVEGKSSYTVNYFLQELDESYTLTDTVEVEDVLYYTQVNAEIKEYEGYEVNEEDSVTSGRLTPGKKLELNIYYDRISYEVTYKYSEEYEIPEGAPEVPEAESHVWESEVTVADVPEAPKGYKFVGWTFAEDSSSAEGTFEMPKKDVIIEGHFEQLEYYLVVEWDYEDGEYHGGTYTWDCKQLKYVQDTTEAGWSTLPRVKCTVRNEGSAPVNLEFIATVDSWNPYLSTNPFEESSKELLEAGETYSFEFTDFDWNIDKLNEEAYKVAIGEVSSPNNEHTNTFELRITEVE